MKRDLAIASMGIAAGGLLIWLLLGSGFFAPLGGDEGGIRVKNGSVVLEATELQFESDGAAGYRSKGKVKHNYVVVAIGGSCLNQRRHVIGAKDITFTTTDANGSDTVTHQNKSNATDHFELQNWTGWSLSNGEMSFGQPTARLLRITAEGRANTRIDCTDPTDVYFFPL